MEVLVLFGMVIGLLLIGVPIAISLGLSSTLFLLIYSGSSLGSVAGTLFEAFEGHYTLLAIPFFILASAFMTTGGVAQRIILYDHRWGRSAHYSLFDCLCRAFAWRPRHRRRFRLHAVCRLIRLIAGHRGGDRHDCDRGHAPSRL
jgi:hypothetical protein